MERGGSRIALLVAAVVVVALEYFVPSGRYLLYPFTLLTTWVHEMGHGLTALAVGGSFERLQIFADASGLATFSASPGGRTALVALGGLLAPPLTSAVVLMGVRGPTRAQAFLVALALGLGISLVLWVRSPVGLLAVPALALLIAAGARFGSNRVRMVLVQLLAVVLGLDTVTRTLHYLFVERVENSAVAGGLSDIGQVAANLGGPYWFWGALVAALAVALLAIGLWSAVAPAAGAAPAPIPEPPG